MNIADPIYLEHLRDLPSGYLLDLMADNDDIDEESIYWVLQERGMAREEIERKLRRRKNARWPRPYQLWSSARWLTVFNALIVAYFNITGLYQLLVGNHAFRGPLLFLAAGSILCGFAVGFKLTTHLYQGGKALMHCGFPIPVGFVDLQTGKEIEVRKPFLIVRMALNALVGVCLTVFPIVFIYIMMAR